MNLIELYLTINPNFYFKSDTGLKIYRQEIIKETDKQIKINNFGHKYSSIITKTMLDKIQREEMLEVSVHSIKRWIYVKEDENYNEENLKVLLVNDVLEEIESRRNRLDKMCELVKAV